MNKPTCYYTLLARTALRNTESKEIEFNVVEKKFENNNPILAREAVFAERNEFIRGMLTEGIGESEEGIGWNTSEKKIEKLSEREIRKLINPYLEPEDESDNNEEKWIAPDDTLSWYKSFNNGIWVIMKHNDTDLHEQCNGDDDIVIDKVSRYEEPLPTPPNYNNLEEEYKFYKKHKYDTKNYETSFKFFDDEAFLEGAEDEDDALITIECLKTPFDWTGYDKVYWWDSELSKNPAKTVEGEPNLQKTTLTITMDEALNSEENQFCKFKPGLINWASSNRNLEYEVVQAICAFLNAKGGYLFIGLDDKGVIIGLDFSRITKDDFRKKFTSIKTHYIAPSIAHTIYGEFYTVNEKEIFVITIYPSLHEPIFLWRKDDNNKLICKEFYVRSDAASRHIYDIEEIVKYCRTRWKI